MGALDETPTQSEISLDADLGRWRLRGGRGQQQKNILPGKLESGKEYVLWINSNLYQKFKDKSGNPSFPYWLAFQTAASR